MKLRHEFQAAVADSHISVSQRGTCDCLGPCFGAFIICRALCEKLSVFLLIIYFLPQTSRSSNHKK